MLREINHAPDKKRILKKVRPYYLHKRADDEPLLVDPATKYLCDNSGHILHSASGLIEINRKICLGPHHLNPFYKIVGPTTEDRLTSKMITLNLQPIKESAPLPWEYTLKRLESYGDLDLATWAHRMAKYYDNYPKVMGQYEELVNKGDPETLKTLREAKRKAQELCNKIETEFSYYKVLHTLTKDSHQLLSFSYSDGLLAEMGYDQESFLKMIKNRGFPAVFDTNCTVYLNIVKNLLECSIISNDIINMGEEYETLIYDSHGSKHKVMVQLIHIFEPTRKGFALYSYFVLKNGAFCRKTSDISQKLKELGQEKNEIDHKSLKSSLREDINENDSEADTEPAEQG